MRLHDQFTALRLTPGNTDRWPVAWVSAASGALVALAYWQQAPAWGRLAVVLVLTLAAAAMLPMVRRPRLPGLLAVGTLLAGLGLAARDTATLTSLSADWPGWSAAEREARAQRVAVALTQVAGELRDAARRLASDTALQIEAQERRVRPLDPPLSARVESAVLVFDRAELVASAGQAHTEIAAFGPSGVRLVDGAFHTSLVARERSEDGRIEVVTMALVSSAPPADRFTRPLLETLPGGFDVALTVVESPDSTRVDPGTTVVIVPNGPDRLARVRATAFSEGEIRLRAQERARSVSSVVLAVAMIAILVVAWRRPAATAERMAASVVVLAALSMSPSTSLSNISPLFDPANYYAPMGGSLTANVASLLASSALVLAMLFFALRTRGGRLSRYLSVALVATIATGGPFLLRDLARGIALPSSGASFGLWVAWQLALSLVGTAILLAGSAAGRVLLGRRSGIPAVVAPLLAMAAAVAGPLLWDAPGAWPAWYPLLWVLAIVVLAFTRRGFALFVAAAMVAGAGAVTLTWGTTVRARMALAQHDLERMGTVDENALRLLARFAGQLRDEARPLQRSDVLLRRYAASELALAGYPARLARWRPEQPDSAVSVLELVPVTDSLGAQAYLAQVARFTQNVELRFVDDGAMILLLAAVPVADGTVTTIAVPPRTRLLPADPFTAFTGVTGTSGSAPPYRLQFVVPSPDDMAPRPLTWRRRGDVMFGDGVAGDASGVRGARVEVELRGLDALVPRGALLIMVDLVVVILLWAPTALADGVLLRWLRVRRLRWSRSYRVRLSAALLMFFVTPAGIFALWSWYRLRDDDRTARELLLRETLRVAAAEQEQRSLGSSPSSTGAPLFLYANGALVAASDSLLDALAPLGRLIPESYLREVDSSEDQFITHRVPAGRSRALVGYRRAHAELSMASMGSLLATPARGDEFALDERREDLGILLLFAMGIGALAAIWSSGIAARSLARPVGALREAALAVAAGNDAPRLGTAPASEFAPVYRAFARMAQDLTTSRAALEAARQRTAAVLQNVASGVLAILDNGEIILANPRAEAMLGLGVSVDQVATLDLLAAEFPELKSRTQSFLSGAAEEEAFDLLSGDRQFRARLTRLPAGAVLTLDDVTDLAAAQRVLAWGEMARQVAHEIKNPLTPIRLGVQHLRRAYRDGRSDYAQILDTNVTRVLAEIDHLDEIARAFSKYGTARENRIPAEAVDLLGVVRDVVALESMGDAERHNAVQWRVVVDEAFEYEKPLVRAVSDELREVLLNLLENARLAGSQTVSVRVAPLVRFGGRSALLGEGEEEGEGEGKPGVLIEVRDDGCGIDASTLQRVFEPHFSTRTSGSGLGLAISRRLIEGWGGAIELTSESGSGTTVRVVLAAAAQAANEGDQ